MAYRLDVSGHLRPLRGHILADAFIGHMRKIGNILLPDDTIVREWNIKHRWFRVYRVGEDIDWLKPGEWILVRHGRWSQKWHLRHPDDDEPREMFRIDPDGILMIADEPLTKEERIKSV